MSATVDVAIRFGYPANGYHGVQIQPDVRTVQAELERALRRRSWLGRNEHIALSSRTDAGVRVVMNGARLRLAEDIWATVGPNRMRHALQEGTPADLHVHDLMLAPEGWRPRYASHRTYRYRMEMLEHWTSIPLQDQTFERILMMFEGRHDFTNFARLEEGNDPIRRVLHCRPWVANGRIVGFEIRGEAFLWNMIRRIAPQWTASCATDGRRRTFIGRFIGLMTPSTWALRMQAPFSFGMSRGRICHRCPPTRSSCSARMAQRLGNLGACVRSGTRPPCHRCVGGSPSGMIRWIETSSPSLRWKASRRKSPAMISMTSTCRERSGMRTATSVDRPSWWSVARNAVAPPKETPSRTNPLTRIGSGWVVASSVDG